MKAKMKMSIMILVSIKKYLILVTSTKLKYYNDSNKLFTGEMKGETGD